MLYGNCTSRFWESPFVRASKRSESQGDFHAVHKNLNNQRRLWWARQGLNLRPHPCEGRERFGVTACNRVLIHDPRNVAVRVLYDSAFRITTREHAEAMADLLQRAHGTLDHNGYFALSRKIRERLSCFRAAFPGEG